MVTNGNISFEEMKDKIFCEDCLIGMKRIPDGSVDAVICDLPYGTTACAWDSVIPFDKLWEQYNRIVKPKGAILLFGSEPFSTIVRMSNLKAYRYDWVWEKGFPSNFMIANYQPLKTFENVMVFGKESPNYYPIKRKRDKPIYKSKNSNSPGGATTRITGKKVQEFEGKVYDDYMPEAIIHFNSRQDTSPHFHPTQKPVDLLRYLVLTYTNEGDTVLDNCSGSGTTAVAAWREKRHFICFEKDPVYWEKSVKRLKNEMMQQRLF